MTESANYKPKLVVILSRFPFPLEKGDKLRAFYQIKELSKDFSISLIAISKQKIPTNSIEKLDTYCDSIHVVRITNWSIFWNLSLCILNNKPFQVGYFYSLKGHLKVKQLLKQIKPNYIYCQLVRASEYVKNYHDCPKTIDYMDALSKGIDRRIAKAPWYSKWLFRSEAKRLTIYERSIFDYFENKTIISEQDKEYISHPDKSNIICIPNGIDASFFEEQVHTSEYDLVFVGNLSYAPNIEAVEYIAHQLLPQNKQLTCLISGASPRSSVQKIGNSNQQITLQGWVADIRTTYCKGRIFIAPMMIGTGMQNKLLEAMALGIPCVTTSLANNAINAIHLETIYVANTVDEFLEAIENLTSNSELYQRIAQQGRDFVLKNYKWENATTVLKETILSK
jgi:glycosyltransferase involved in cell wall biosynthesis